MGIMQAVKKGFAETAKLMNVVLIFFIFNTVIGLISLPLVNPARAGEPGIVAISVISSLIFFLIFIFLQGGALGLVRDRIKTATSSMANFTAYGKKFYGRIFGLLLLYIIVAISIVLVLTLISAGILLMGDNILTRSIVAAIVTAVAVITITLLIYPIYSIVVDDLGAFSALKKGISVAREHFWRTLGLFVVLLIISMVISLVIGFVVGLISVALNPAISQVLVTIVNAAVQSYIPIVMMVAFMAFYMSLKAGETATAGIGPEEQQSV